MGRGESKLNFNKLTATHFNYTIFIERPCEDNSSIGLYSIFFGQGNWV